MLINDLDRLFTSVCIAAFRFLAVTLPALCTSHNLHLACCLVAFTMFLYKLFTFFPVVSNASYDSFILDESNSDVIVGLFVTLVQMGH